MTYTVLIERGPTSYGAYVPDLPGCVAVGATEDEVRELIREAIVLHIAGFREDGESIPPPATSAELVEVPADPVQA
ncbi:MAG: type II toxin-antitoxin system HicB family antitoxin [Chloroflexi bacterium]|nr:type II toxin-antitoxin system HicB family antitoxin [Chloroflexota bacterium]